ncbi:MAG: ABC transporter ATP-binding protein [Clostridiales bacterium]|nr:ABC transporter ATP-binding protein [Clostridiales bacterium]
MARVELRNVDLNYHTEAGEVVALKDVNLEVQDQEFVAIVGQSGCGKSTLLSLVSGLLTPTRGSVTIDGNLVQGPSKRVGYMLQQDYLFEWRTILDNALLGLEIRKEKTPKAVEEIKEMLKVYGLGGFEDYYPSQLSGGMRQRVALIRTLATKPDVLLLDEPFSALDYQNRLSVGEEVVKILRERKKTVLMVTHDIPEAVSMANRVVVMTPRPGTIRSIHSIKMCDEGLTPLQTRDVPEFRQYFGAIWKELNADVQ